MTIHGIPSHPPGPLTPDPLGSPEGNRVDRPTTQDQPPVDRVEISSAARSLAETAETGRADTAEITESVVPTDRLRTVLQRLSDGFYDAPGVRRALAERIAPDLGLNPQAPTGSSR